jgi:hypothetical protein
VRLSLARLFSSIRRSSHFHYPLRAPFGNQQPRVPVGQFKNVSDAIVREIDIVYALGKFSRKTDAQFV